MGTENIKSLLDYGFGLGSKIKEITAADSPGGKKVTITEIIGSIGMIVKIPSVIAEAPLAYQEWKDLDDTEAAEIKEYFAAKFDIADDKIEALTEEVWGMLVRIGKIIAILD
jgi:hypothetical protein